MQRKKMTHFSKIEKNCISFSNTLVSWWVTQHLECLSFSMLWPPGVNSSFTRFKYMKVKCCSSLNCPVLRIQPWICIELTKLGELEFSRKPFVLYFTFGKSFLNTFLFPDLVYMKQEVFPEDLFPTVSYSKHSQLTFYDSFLKLNSF